MEDNFRIKGTVYNRMHQPVSDIQVRAYDRNGIFLADALTDNNGFIDFECASRPTTIKFINKSRIIASKAVADTIVSGNIIDIGKYGPICMIPFAQWHISGVVRDKMSGEPLPGLRVEVWDEDKSISGGPFYDPLWKGAPLITDEYGAFETWFNAADFTREATWIGEKKPDVVIKIFNSKDILIHQTPVDQNVSGSPHSCFPFCFHKGKEYAIDVDYLTVAINKVGPVNVADINASGRATVFAKIPDRPFGGYATISGRIWGAKINKWKLYDAAGFVDSEDERFNGLKSTSATPNGFVQIAEGMNKIWDGPIHKWETSALGKDEVHTIILIVWDQNENEYHKTQFVFIHNAPITPPVQITSPAPGSTVSKKAAKDVIKIVGIADDDFFQYYHLLWAGPTMTELTDKGINFQIAGGNHTPKDNKLLAEWDIKDLPIGPYVIRLEAHDRTIVDDGIFFNNDWTWNTINIAN